MSKYVSHLTSTLALARVCNPRAECITQAGTGIFIHAMTVAENKHETDRNPHERRDTP